MASSEPVILSRPWMLDNPWGFFTMDVGGIWGEDAFLRGAVRRKMARRRRAFIKRAH
jgi:hypothetical protein